MKLPALSGLVTLLAAFVPASSAQVYSVSTLAGLVGAPGYVDGNGATARFNGPAAIAVDGAGNIFLGETSSTGLRKITPAGVVGTFTTLTSGTVALVVDPVGNIYVSDASSHVIRRVAADGSVSLIAGQPGSAGSADGTGTAARFSSPQGIARDAAGNLFIADGSNHTLRKMTPAGVVTTVAGLAGVPGNVEGPGPLARFNSPTGVAIDAAGNVYVSDSANRVIRKVAPTGDVSTFAGTAGNSGTLDGPPGTARFSSVQGLAIDASGTLFAADAGNSSLRKISPAGVVTTIAGLSGSAGSADGLGSNARFSSPRGVAVDASGNLFVADTGGQTVRKVVFLPAPVIASPPVAATTAAGQSAIFGVTASGTGALTYEWQRQIAGTVGFVPLGNASGYTGATAPTLAVLAATTAMNGDQFRCVIGSDTGSTATAPVLLSVTAPPAMTNAGSTVFYTGQTGQFTFSATGLPAPTFSVSAGTLPSWAILDSVTGVLSGRPPSTAGSPYSFTVTATNGSGTANQSFTLTVQPAPVAPSITSTPASRQLVASGQSLTLGVSVSGTVPFTYQWKRNGLPIAGATAASYTITNAKARDGGYYQVVVGNPGGAVTSGPVYVLVTYATTQVVAWGPDVALPGGLTSVVAVAAGGGHNLALKSDGTVVGWGNNDYGQITIPGVNSIVGIAAGGYHSLALKSNGTVVAWGNNSSGQATVPGDLSGVVAISAGQTHSLALKQDGTVVAWGSPGSAASTVPAGLSGVVAISAGSNYSLALKADGTVVAWGDSGGYSMPATLSGVVAIAAGSYPSSMALAVKSDGTVVFWGSNSWGQGSVPAGLSGVVSVGLGYYQATALKSDGTIVTWGADYNTVVPLPANLRSVVAISAGTSQRLALRDASNDQPPTVVTSPSSVTANLGQSVVFNMAASAGTAPINYQWFKDGVAIAGATAASYTVSGVSAASAGSYFATASNPLGSVNSSTATLSVNAAPVVSAAAGGRYPLAVGQGLTLTLASSISGSATVQWRHNGISMAGANGRSLVISNATLGDGGYYQAVYNDGSGAVVSAAIFVPVRPAATQVVVWGSDYISSSSDLSVLTGLTTAIGVAARSSTTLVLKSDGTVTRFGSYSYPVPADLANVVAVAVGSAHYLALRGDGTVTTWSDSSYSLPPAVPDGLTNVVAIAAGTYHSLALRGDGTVVAWGTASYGATAVPAGLVNVVAVAAGDGFSLALRNDGTVVGWGADGNGQSAVPSGLNDVTAIAAGSSYSLALKRDGTVVAWGNNSSGQATPPAGLANVVAIAAGDSHAVAVKNDGTVVGWGYNNYGETTPPAGLTNVLGVAGGYYHSVALRDAGGDMTPAVTVQPVGASAFTGQVVTFSVGANAGTAPLAYQWRKSGVTLAGATNASLVVSGVTPAQAGSYDVVVSNYLGTAFSRPADLAVSPVLAVTTNPTGRQVLASGQAVTLSGATALPGPVSYQWRRNGQPIPGATSVNFAISNAVWSDAGVYQLVATNNVGPAVSAPVFVLVSAGAQLRAWGDNGSGQTSVPPSLTNVVAAAAGYTHSLALKADGTVVAWGSNSSGQTNVPAGLANVVAIAAGYNFSMALAGDGTVTTWGAINYTPPEATGALAVAANTFSGVAMVLKADGTVIAWDASSRRTDVPPGLRGVVAIASGYYFNVALQADGSVVQWGPSGSAGVAAGLAGVVAIASGYDHVLALKADGSVVAWGNSNSYGDLSVPTGLTGVVAISAGYQISCALKADGSVVVWGGYPYGSSPLSPGVAALAPAMAISLGNAHALGLRDPSHDVAPVIASLSSGQTVTPGQNVTLSVTASGTPPPTYQWYRNGFVVSGATSASLVLNGVSTSSAGSYTVTVSNALGAVTSGEIVLVVNPTLNQRGLLIATGRAETGAGIAGTFTIEGTVSKQMLVRAVGPTLTAFSVPDVLSDPQLTITSPSGAVIATNDDWGSAPNASQIASVAQQVGAYALPVGGKDAAILRTYSPGTYHARVAAAGASAGVAMLEIYDADSSPRLVYVATNAFAGVGGKVFVQGFAVAGLPAGRSYLIRALGPSLGSTGALADPRLAVFNSAGVQVAANDDWGGDTALAALASSVGAMPLSPTSKDAAVNFVPAGPGAYVVQVSDATGGTGSALLEIFEIDSQRSSNAGPAIVAQPRGLTILPGTPVTLGLAVIGNPAPVFQWRKNGVAIAGATDAILALSNPQAADAGDYTVVVTNSGGTVTSSAATLGVVTQLATHDIVGHGYVAGSTVTITNTLSYAGTVTGLGWQVTLPLGWSYVSGGGTEGDVRPAVGSTGVLEWAWTSPPASPVTFTYTLNVPAGETGSKSLAGIAIVQAAGSPVTSTAAPGSLIVGPAPLMHSADTDQDGSISLAELLRVIELYNYRSGTVRTGEYTMQAGTEDGYVAGSGGGAVTVYHSADTNHDGRLGLFELLRMIELYNYRSGSVRTGQYHVAVGTEDGFTPGP